MYVSRSSLEKPSWPERLVPTHDVAVEHLDVLTAAAARCRPAEGRRRSRAARRGPGAARGSPWAWLLDGTARGSYWRKPAVDSRQMLAGGGGAQSGGAVLEPAAWQAVDRLPSDLVESNTKYPHALGLRVPVLQAGPAPHGGASERVPAGRTSRLDSAHNTVAPPLASADVVSPPPRRGDRACRSGASRPGPRHAARRPGAGARAPRGQCARRPPRLSSCRLSGSMVPHGEAEGPSRARRLDVCRARRTSCT